MKVFIQNEARSDLKNIHNEKTLEYKRTETVSRAYPYPYGFILNTTSGDGDNLDCFIITKKSLKTGQIMECEPIGIMEQVEDNQEDSNILATLAGEDAQIDDEIKVELTEFAAHVFDHIKGKEIIVGRFLGKKEAVAYIKRCTDGI